MTKLNQYRKALGISQLELSKRVEVSRQTINIIPRYHYVSSWRKH